MISKRPINKYAVTRAGTHKLYNFGESDIARPLVKN